MESSFTKRYIFKTLMAISLILGIIFFYLNHIDFISSAIEYGKMNIPNIAYALLRVIGGMFIPMIFIVPSVFEYGRIRLAKAGFIAYGICHVITISWAIYFFATKDSGSLFNIDSTTTFLDNGGFVYPLTIWDTYGIASIIFAVIYGIASIYTGIYFDKDKDKVKWLVLVLLGLRLLLTFLNNIAFQGRVYSLFWITNNYLELAAQLCFTIAIFLAAFDTPCWVEFVWDQIPIAENEEEDE